MMTPELQAHRLINEHRAKLGLPLLMRSRRLTHAARAHARDEAARHYLAHDTPAGAGIKPMRWDRRIIHFLGRVAWRRVAENTADGYDTATAVVQAWLDSPEHRANIEDRELNRDGIASATAADGTRYWTHDFAAA